MKVADAKYPLVVVFVLFIWMMTAMCAFGDNVYIRVISSEKAVWSVKWDLNRTYEDMYEGNFIEKTRGGEGEELFYIGETEQFMELLIFFELLTRDELNREGGYKYMAVCSVVIQTDRGKYEISIHDTALVRWKEGIQ